MLRYISGLFLSPSLGPTTNSPGKEAIEAAVLSPDLALSLGKGCGDCIRGCDTHQVCKLCKLFACLSIVKYGERRGEEVALGSFSSFFIASMLLTCFFMHVNLPPYTICRSLLVSLYGDHRLLGSLRATVINAASELV